MAPRAWAASAALVSVAGQIEQGCQPVRQRPGGEGRLRHQPRATRIGHGLRVGGLVVVHSVGIGHQDGGTADGGQFGDGRGAGAADGQMAAGQTFRHVAEEGGQLGFDAGLGEGGFRRFDVLGAALLGDPDPALEHVGQERQRLGNDLAEDAGTLAAADHQQMDLAAVFQGRIGQVANGCDVGADGVAGEHQLAGIAPA